jgi:tetratricopeptide (TPR) repeat protein
LAGYQIEDKTKLRKLWIDHAIQLAMQSKWTEAVAINRNILEITPNDVDALNRLGRALREQGQYREAREAYQRAVEHDPNNTIAQKNLASLAHLKAESSDGEKSERVDSRLFISEAGKTGQASLVRVTDKTAVAKMAVGDQVHLHPEGRALYVRNGRGDTLGQVETKVAQRLIDLIRGGNKYAAALVSADESNPRLIIHEMSQHPSQKGKVSFPTRSDATNAVRGYTKESLVKYSDFEEDDDDGDGEPDGYTPEGESDGEESLEPSEFEEESQNE